MSEESRAFRGRLEARIVSLEGVEVAEGKLDDLFDSHEAAIVRPDRYVLGGAAADWSLDRLVAFLESRMALRAQARPRPPA